PPPRPPDPVVVRPAPAGHREPGHVPDVRVRDQQHRPELRVLESFQGFLVALLAQTFDIDALLPIDGLRPPRPLHEVALVHTEILRQSTHKPRCFGKQRHSRDLLPPYSTIAPTIYR